jgi:hypothetical protein
VLDQTAAMEDGDVVGEAGGQREVVGDEEEGEAVLGDEGVEEGGELGGGDGVERAGGFVGDEEHGPAARAAARAMRWHWPPGWCG